MTGGGSTEQPQVTPRRDAPLTFSLTFSVPSVPRLQALSYLPDAEAHEIKDTDLDQYRVVRVSGEITVDLREPSNPMSETEPLRPFDTSPQIEQVQISLLRRASVARRIASARGLSETVIGLSRRGIRRANPGLDGKELACMIVAHHYGPALAARLRTCLDSKEV